MKKDKTNWLLIIGIGLLVWYFWFPISFEDTKNFLFNQANNFWLYTYKIR